MLDIEKRFLIIRLSSIGDIVHTLPAVAALGKTFPDAQIYWAAEAHHAALLEGNPFVHRVITLDTLGWRRKSTLSETIEEAIKELVALREISFDAAVDFQGLYKSGLLAWLSRSRERVGFAEKWLREPMAGVFYTERVSPRDRRHVIEMNLALVERLGARPARAAEWEFPLPRSESDERYIDEQVAALDRPGFIVLNPGGGWRSKCWAPTNYAELIRRLEADLPCQILLTGSRSEEDLIRAILGQGGARRARYVPSTLAQLVALARRARLFVAGDTGPLHLAAAAGTPIVAIYNAGDALNTPERNGPFSSTDIVLLGGGAANHTRHSKHPDWLQGVSVDSVLAAIHDRLARTLDKPCAG